MGQSKHRGTPAVMPPAIGNLTRSGERIGMSEPAMSAALARLRRHFADDLLEREGRGYKRPVFGEQLLPTVRDALRQVEATMRRSPRFDPAESDREFPGRHAELFRDRFACVVGASNPRLRDGRLTLDDLSGMPPPFGLVELAEAAYCEL